MFNLFKRNPQSQPDYWQKEAESARRTIQQYENGMISTPAMRDRYASVAHEATKRYMEVVRLNRVLQRRRRTINNLRNRHYQLMAAAMNLRLAQQAYAKAGTVEEMEATAAEVCTAAAILDTLLPKDYLTRMSTKAVLERMDRVEIATTHDDTVSYGAGTPAH